jgi:hypothetical protein
MTILGIRAVRHERTFQQLWCDHCAAMTKHLITSTYDNGTGEHCGDVTRCFECPIER